MGWLQYSKVQPPDNRQMLPGKGSIRYLYLAVNIETIWFSANSRAREVPPSFPIASFPVLARAWAWAWACRDVMEGSLSPYQVNPANRTTPSSPHSPSPWADDPGFRAYTMIKSRLQKHRPGV
ncbi:hypothetical protein V2G26_011277 [Clonostachys chloroleuca]